MSQTSPTRRALATAGVAAALALAAAPAAQAHVRVIPESTTGGGWSVLTFRVPTESETASTSAVTVDLPQDTPLAHVGTRPVPGWTATVTTADLPKPVDLHGTTITKAPVSVTWTASPGAEVAPGQFQEFELQVGPLPDAGTEVVLPAHQTYTDGTVVDWADPPAAGGEEPEHPAPVLTTTASTDDDAHAPAAPTATPTAEAVPHGDTAAGAQDTAATSGDAVGRALGAGGLALGIVALAVAVGNARRNRGKA